MLKVVFNNGHKPALDTNNLVVLLENVPRRGHYGFFGEALRAPAQGSEISKLIIFAEIFDGIMSILENSQTRTCCHNNLGNTYYGSL